MQFQRTVDRPDDRVDVCYQLSHAGSETVTDEDETERRGTRLASDNVER